MMGLYHTTYDLDTFGGYPIQSTSGFWARFADTTAFAFVFLVGVSLTISYSRVEAKLSGWKLFRKYLLRGLRIIGYGMILTAFTWATGMGVIVFGILHLIGVSIILAYPFLRFRFANLILAFPVIAAGLYIHALGFYSEHIWLVPFGVLPENLAMPDYRPLLPWFGVVLLGLFAGNVLYAYVRRTIQRFQQPQPVKSLAFLGRHSLFIYLIHQPIIVAVLSAFGVIDIGLF